MTDQLSAFSKAPDSLPNLDLLRAFAVVLVFLDHSLLYLVPGGNDVSRWIVSPLRIGRFGVLLFFVHTCLVLMLSLARRSRGSRPGSMAVDFYIRRWFRIYPLCCALILVSILVHIPVGPNEPFLAPSRPTVLSNLLLIQNITHTPSIIGPLWSLPYEVQMYLLLPFLFLLTKSTRGLAITGMVYIAVIAGSLSGPAIGLRGVYLIEFVPCFLSGLLSFVIFRHKPHAIAPWWLWFGFVASIGLLFAAVSPGTGSSYELKEWGGCLLVGASLPFSKQVGVQPIVVAANRIATYSYGAYLTHIPVMWIVRSIGQQWPIMLKVGLAVILTAVCSAITYHFIERPFQQWGGKIASGRPPFRPRAMAAARQ